MDPIICLQKSAALARFVRECKSSEFAIDFRSAHFPAQLNTLTGLIPMYGLDRKRRVGLRASVFITLWSGMLFAPRAVHAECSHYVVFKNDPAQLLATLEQRVFSDASGQGQSDPRDIPNSNRPSPCPGGMCSQGPTLPLAPGPDPVMIDPWGLLASQGVLDGAGTADCPVREESVRPLGFRLAIFHPPRIHFSTHAS
jgi:hypothetical protein